MSVVRYDQDTPGMVIDENQRVGGPGQAQRRSTKGIEELNDG